MIKKNISTLNCDCYGCGVCQLICPVNIITNAIGKDGFIRPQIINQDKCINCGLCLKICSFNNREELIFNQPLCAYAVWSDSSENRFEASSGGVVPALFEKLLDNGYVVNCVEFDSKSNSLVYYTPSNPSDLKRGKKSKYLQSFFITEIDYDKDNVIIGTPCAIASFRRVLEKKRPQGDFVLIDFFCHGVPSYLLWAKYLKFIGIEHPTEAIWRDKQNGWHDSWRMIVRRDGQLFSQFFTKGDLFYKFFLRNRCLRSSCYDSCVFKSTNSSADIRVGDLWGSKYRNDENGVSGVLVMTEAGSKALQLLNKSCTFAEESIQTVTESQMKKCAKRPSSFNYVQKSLIKNDITLVDIDKKASRIEMIKDIIPQKLKYYVSRIIPKLLGR